ncbi:MAG: glycosyltransferase [Chromatiaceae bacterium]
MNDHFLSDADFQAIPAVEINPSVPPDGAPLVSVLMITWNHGAFVARAIESVVGQACPFRFELLIGEDASGDETRAVCEDYQGRYPDIIRLIVAESNVGMHRNLARLWWRARGRYIALCEGDDYWSDSCKLAKQAAWLEARPTVWMCGAYTRKVARDAGGDWVEVGSVRPARVKERYGVEDLIPDYAFHTSSVLVRREGIRFPRWFWDLYCADRPLYLLCAERGDVGVIREVMSVYRLHEGGVWAPAGLVDKAEKGISLFETLDAYFEGRYHALIRRTLANIIWSYMASALDAGHLAPARRLYWLSLRYRTPGGLARSGRYWAVAWLRLYGPRLYRWLKRWEGAVGGRDRSTEEGRGS